MKTTWLCALLLLASPILGAPAPFGEDPRSDLTEISASLKDIARTLKQQAEMQKSHLMLKRVTLASTQL